MAQKTKAVVKIAGREYTIRAYETEEYIHSVAIYVNRKMEQIEQTQPGLSTTMAAILTAMNLADEVIKLKAEVDELKGRLKELEDQSRPAAQPTVFDVQRKAKR